MCENIYKFVSSFQMSCTASTFMQLPFRKGGNGTESLLPLSLYRSRPTQPKINFMWEICTYCSSICTLGLLLNSKLCFPTPKSKIIYKSFFCLKHFFRRSNGQQVLISSFLFVRVFGMSFLGYSRPGLVCSGMTWLGAWFANWRLILLFQQHPRNERLFSFVCIKIWKYSLTFQLFFFEFGICSQFKWLPQYFIFLVN